MYRNSGKEVLSKYIKSEKNMIKLENKINTISNNQDEYRLIILEIIKYKREGIGSKELMSILKDDCVLEKSKEYDEYREKIKEHDGFLVKPFEVDEGVLECGKCGSNKTISYTKQTRSGDEATSVFALCYQCNNKWKM
jgi:DNA-directed RNA polymerase subunit M/transcription elongation factor TFIIS